jgi:hypothetical protein
VKPRTNGRAISPRQLVGYADAVRRHLEGDATLTVDALVALTGAPRGLVSRARARWRFEREARVVP